MNTLTTWLSWTGLTPKEKTLLQTCVSLLINAIAVALAYCASLAIAHPALSPSIVLLLGVSVCVSTLGHGIQQWLAAQGQTTLATEVGVVTDASAAHLTEMGDPAHTIGVLPNGALPPVS